MNKIFNAPLQVYLCFGVLMLAGIFSYFSLPVALFPNSTKPVVGVYIPFGNLTREAWIATYGGRLEGAFRAIHGTHSTLDEVTGNYDSQGVDYVLSFSWGDVGNDCLKEVNQVIAPIKSSWPENVQRTTYSYINAKGTGFLLGSFSSRERSLGEIFHEIEPSLQAKLSAIREANNPHIYDPTAQQILLELHPLKMASFNLLPRDVFQRVREHLASYNSGVLNENGGQLAIELGAKTSDIKDLEKILITTKAKQQVYLNEIAELKLAPSERANSNYKIDGAPALVIFVSPAPGENIKVMSEKVLKAVQETLASDGVGKDIKFNLLINPAETINNSLANILQEVGLCSLIAVIVLFIFLGSFFGTLTALIEIPMSIVLSFILMKLSGVQLNLISLGGLALSVGMNVDASIVVIDGIVKKFKHAPETSRSHAEIIAAVGAAVREVYVPVVIATITSLVVFLPLIFTSALTYAILGDLTKAVIFSHGISMFIALILVPTVRIHMAKRFGGLSEAHAFPWVERSLEGLYAWYVRSLGWFLGAKKIRLASYLLLTAAIISAAMTIPSRLKREIIGTPTTAIMTAHISGPFTHRKEIQETAAKFQRQVYETFPGKVDFIFEDAFSDNAAFLAIKLHDKRHFQGILEKLQSMTKDQLEVHYNFGAFNPAELPIPQPPDWRIAAKGKNVEKTQEVLAYFRSSLLESDLLDYVSGSAQKAFDNKIDLRLYDDVGKDPSLSPSDLAEVISLSSHALDLGNITINNYEVPIRARYPEQSLASKADITALPVPFAGSLVPLRALVEMKTSKQAPELVRINGENAFQLEGYFTEKEKLRESELMTSLARQVAEFKETTLDGLSKEVSLHLVDAKIELTTALRELSWAILISIVLIFLVLLLQFASVVHSLIIMLAIPFGILGVLISLFVFNSTLSLNSALGVILLVGITVANSIMLVEKFLRLLHAGLAPEQAILETARQRIRPILMTSLITILGMLPIALGYGEGGKVLQPLGIAICGGLWVSLVFTLYIIPALELAYVGRDKAR